MTTRRLTLGDSMYRYRVLACCTCVLVCAGTTALAQDTTATLKLFDLQITKTKTPPVLLYPDQPLGELGHLNLGELTPKFAVESYAEVRGPFGGTSIVLKLRLVDQDPKGFQALAKDKTYVAGFFDADQRLTFASEATFDPAGFFDERGLYHVGNALIDQITLRPGECIFLRIPTRWRLPGSCDTGINQRIAIEGFTEHDGKAKKQPKR